MEERMIQPALMYSTEEAAITLRSNGFIWRGKKTFEIFRSYLHFALAPSHESASAFPGDDE